MIYSITINSEHGTTSNIPYISDGKDLNIKLIFTNDSMQTANLYYSDTIPSGKSFLGLSTSQGQTIVDIPPYGKANFNLTEDTSFYDIFAKEIIPSDTFKIELYQCSCEQNRVNKTEYLTSVGSLIGVLRDEASMSEMSITIQSKSLPIFNYCYIGVFNRYYFVTEITSVNYGLWEISLSIDVLMSYKNALLQCKGFIDRNENTNNPYIVDRKRVIEQGQTLEVATVDNKLFGGVAGFTVTGFIIGAKTGAKTGE